jgi:hypothetical protein
MMRGTFSKNVRDPYHTLQDRRDAKGCITERRVVTGLVIFPVSRYLAF